MSGRATTLMPPHEIARRNVIFMPGGRGVFPDLTVKENLLLAGWANPEEATEAGLAEVLEIFPRLVERYDAKEGCCRVASSSNSRWLRPSCKSPSC